MSRSGPEPFTLALVQSATVQATRRSDVKRNLNRAIEILERVDMFSFTHRLLGTDGEQERWAPVRLVHFPESFLQGFFIDATGDLQRWRDEFAIDIPGESVITGVVRLDHLRDRRRDDANNYLAQLRTDVYAEMYAESIYPPGWMKEPFKNVADYGRRTPRRLGVMDRLVARGVFEHEN
jgi:hypothetical protein